MLFNLTKKKNTSINAGSVILAPENPPVVDFFSSEVFSAEKFLAEIFSAKVFSAKNCFRETDFQEFH